MSAIKKAVALATLKPSAITKLNQYISISMSTLRKEIGSTLYARFLELPDDALIHGDEGYVPYELLTEDERIRRDLETAQAYFLLYFAVPGLKEFEVGAVTLDKLSFGEGELTPSKVNSLEQIQEIYWKMAIDICNDYSGTNGFGISVI